MTEQQGWTAPGADEAGSGAAGGAASPQHTIPPQAPTTHAPGIPHQAGPRDATPPHATGAAPTEPAGAAPTEVTRAAAGAAGAASVEAAGAAGTQTVRPAPVAGTHTWQPVPYPSPYSGATDTGFQSGGFPSSGVPSGAFASGGFPSGGFPSGGFPGGGFQDGGHLPPQQPMPPHAPHMSAPVYGIGVPPNGPVHAPQKRSRVGIAIAGALVAIALSGGSAVAGGYAVTRLEPQAVSTTVSTTTASRTNGATSLSDVAAAVLPSVVSINTGTAIGSGVVLSADGNILTNNHVVATARGGTVRVTFSSGTTGVATVVGTDAAHDLAVIKVQNAANLKPITFADSGQVKVGDSVLAVGSPLGLDGSVTAGIVSALNRTIDEGSGNGAAGVSIEGALQTDAAINPGNSGGALVNSAGQLIGINTAIASATQQQAGNIGVGFAISSNTAKQVANKIMGR